MNAARKGRLLLLLLLSLYAGPGFPVLSALTGRAEAGMPHYANGALGLGAATMPEPGWYFTFSNMYYGARQIRDNHGDKIANSFAHPNQRFDFLMESFISNYTLTYASNFKLLGARWSADLTLPIAYYRMKATDTFNIPLPKRTGGELELLNQRSLGVSDLFIQPAVLSWSGDRYDITLSASLFLPVGRFNKDDPTSPGMGYWTVMPGGGFTWYFDRKKSWSFSIMAGYEFNSRQRDSQITPGQQFHFEWGIGKRFAKYWQVGITGYDAWQVTSDQGPNASANKYRAHGIGPEISVVIPKLKGQLSLRSQWEYLNRNTPQGNTTTMALSFSF